MSGILYIVGTPIGNLEDMTYRAVRTLNEVNYILAENSKNSRKLLSHYNIQTQIQTLYSGEEKEADWVIKKLKQGEDIAYISDAGTPGISDPGGNLVRLARKNEIKVVPIPGPSALSAILSISGAQVNPTFFLGFLSEKPIRKEKELEEYKDKEALIVFFESVYKIRNTLEIVKRLFPGAEVLVGRELTKSYENIHFSPVETLNTAQITEKGEFVVLINNHTKKIAKETGKPSDVQG